MHFNHGTRVPRGYSKFHGGRKSNNYRNHSGGRSNRGGAPRSKIDHNKYVSKAKEVKEQDTQIEQVPTGSFGEFGLDSRIKNNLDTKGYTTPTPIQRQTINAIMKGENVLGIASTGTGKTGAFLIPLLNKILTSQNQKLLVVAPTRELAMQIHKEALSIIKGTFIQLALVIGGESIHRQQEMLYRRPHVVIGTPGRIQDMVKRNALKLSVFNNVVVDEVDRMLDMGFIQPIRQIMSQLGTPKQSLFFSATIDRQVENIVHSMAENYTSVKLAVNETASNVDQDIVPFKTPDQKLDKLHEILIMQEVTKILIFADTKRTVDKLEKELRSRGFATGAIHGDKPQNKRKGVITAYRENKFTILLATNVAARGLDISDITHVINYDEPRTYDEYIHRIGRTGRNGKKGKALTFIQKW